MYSSDVKTVMASSSGSNAIRYDLNSYSCVFLCRYCENNILSSNNFLNVIVTPGTLRILCREPVIECALQAMQQIPRQDINYGWSWPSAYRAEHGTKVYVASE
ncbi:hypothetical protein PVK06_005664 [Gossypium arboreum]|uniref:Uncharacterized protein n=1 Tax=Gossypium arboreum TaxID=29729 RepID=A0ABR0QVD0_GOSAR|nr:hypothetical protein PVK06_005664 [Gossypium arboreum]